LDCKSVSSGHISVGVLRRLEETSTVLTGKGIPACGRLVFESRAVSLPIARTSSAVRRPCSHVSLALNTFGRFRHSGSTSLLPSEGLCPASSALECGGRLALELAVWSLNYALLIIWLSSARTCPRRGSGRISRASKPVVANAWSVWFTVICGAFTLSLQVSVGFRCSQLISVERPPLAELLRSAGCGSDAIWNSFSLRRAFGLLRFSGFSPAYKSPLPGAASLACFTSCTRSLLGSVSGLLTRAGVLF